MNEQFQSGLAEIFECEKALVTADLKFDEKWDSLAIVSTIALVDENFGVMLSGKALAKCTGVADVLKLVEQAKAGK
jgi:acyl carrier protein